MHCHEKCPLALLCPSICLCVHVLVWLPLDKFHWYVVLGLLWNTCWENPDEVKIRNIGPFLWRLKYFSDYWLWRDVVQQEIKCIVAFPWQCFQYLFSCLQWHNYAWNMWKLFLQNSPKVNERKICMWIFKTLVFWSNISFLILLLALLLIDLYFSSKLPYCSSDPLQEFK